MVFSVVAAVIVIPVSYLELLSPQLVPVSVSDSSVGYNWITNFRNNVNTFEIPGPELNSTSTFHGPNDISSEFTASLLSQFTYSLHSGNESSFDFLLNVSGNIASDLKPTGFNLGFTATGPGFSQPDSPSFQMSPLNDALHDVANISYNTGSSPHYKQSSSYPDFSFNIGLTNQTGANGASYYHFFLTTIVTAILVVFSPGTIYNLDFTATLNGLSQPVVSKIGINIVNGTVFQNGSITGVTR